MKNRQITALTVAGLLSEIGCGVLLIVLGRSHRNDVL